MKFGKPTMNFKPPKLSLNLSGGENILSISIRKEETLVVAGKLKKNMFVPKRMLRFDTIAYAIAEQNPEELAAFFLRVFQEIGSSNYQVNISLPASLTPLDCFESSIKNPDDRQNEILSNYMRQLEYDDENALVVNEIMAIPIDEAGTRAFISSSCTERAIVELLIAGADIANMDIRSIEPEAVGLFRYLGLEYGSTCVADVEEDCLVLTTFVPDKGIFSLQKPSLGYMEILDGVDGAYRFYRHLSIRDEYELDMTEDNGASETPVFIIGTARKELTDKFRTECGSHQMQKRIGTMPLSLMIDSSDFDDADIQQFAAPLGLALKSIYERMEQNYEPERIMEVDADDELYGGNGDRAEILPENNEQRTKVAQRMQRFFGPSHSA